MKQFPQYELKADFFHDEFPQHRVRITKPFYFGKYEVTNAQFRKFVEATNYKTEAEQRRYQPSRPRRLGLQPGKAKIRRPRSEVQLEQSGLRRSKTINRWST